MFCFYLLISIIFSANGRTDVHQLRGKSVIPPTKGLSNYFIHCTANRACRHTATARASFSVPTLPCKTAGKVTSFLIKMANYFTQSNPLFFFGLNLAPRINEEHVRNNNKFKLGVSEYA